MDKEKLAKFYPYIIGLGILIPLVSIYFNFFAGGDSGRKPTKGTAVAKPDTPDRATSETGEPAPQRPKGLPRDLPAPYKEDWAKSNSPTSLRDYYPPQTANVNVYGQSVPLETLRNDFKQAQSGNDRNGLLEACSKLGEANDIHSIPELFKLMRTSQDVYVRGRAARAVEKILGAGYFYDPDAPVAKRNMALANMEVDYKRIVNAMNGGK